MKIGFFGLLTVIFITLKLTNYINWSWWLVLSPMIAGFVLFLVIAIIVLIVVAKSN